jgi:hypothetical protein
MYAPSMRYVLPALAVDEEELAKIQSAIFTSNAQQARILRNHAN